MLLNPVIDKTLKKLKEKCMGTPSDLLSAIRISKGI
jgi:hypothetical protein